MQAWGFVLSGTNSPASGKVAVYPESMRTSRAVLFTTVGLIMGRVVYLLRNMPLLYTVVLLPASSTRYTVFFACTFPGKHYYEFYITIKHLMKRHASRKLISTYACFCLVLLITINSPYPRKGYVFSLCRTVRELSSTQYRTFCVVTYP